MLFYCWASRRVNIKAVLAVLAQRLVYVGSTGHFCQYMAEPTWNYERADGFFHQVVV